MATLFTRSFTTLLAAQACFGFAFSAFLLLPKFLDTRLGAGPAEIGQVMACFGLTSVLLGPPMGAVVDRFGRRRFFTAGALLMVASSLGFLAVEELGPAVYLLRGAQGAAFALAFVAGSAMAVDEAPPERLALALGIFGLTMLGMNSVAPVVVEVVAARAGWRPVFALAAGTAGASALLSRLLQERRPRPGPGEVVPGLWEVARRPRFLRIALVVGLVGVAFASLFTFHQPFALDLGMRELRGFFVAYTAAAVAVRLGAGPFVDRLGRRRVALVGLAGYTAATFVMAELGRVGLAPIGVLFGASHGLFYPTFNALAMEGAGPHERGKLMALYNGAFNVGGTLGVFALGHAAEAFGFPAVFAVAGSGTALGLAVLAASRLGPAPRADEPRRPTSRPAPSAPPPRAPAA